MKTCLLLNISLLKRYHALQRKFFKLYNQQNFKFRYI